MKRRALAMLLAVMMIISLIPVTASAAECDHSKDMGNNNPRLVTDVDNSRYHFVYCEACGHQYDYASHSFSGGSCSCGALDPNCQHNFVDHEDEGSHVVDCSKCGMVSVVTSCTSYYVNNVCSVCGAVKPGSGTPKPVDPNPPAEEVCEHDDQTYQADAYDHWITCDDCGEVVDLAEEHTFANGKCTKCGTSAPAPVEPEDCEHDNCIYEISLNGDDCLRVCRACDEVVETLEHAYGWIGEDRENGKHDVFCMQCESVYTTEPHAFDANGECECGAAAEVGCQHQGETYFAKSGGGHNLMCYDCGGIIEGLDHVPGNRGIWGGNKEKHNVYCADCGGACGIEAHDFSSGECVCGMVCPHLSTEYAQSEDGKQHRRQCTVCDEFLEEEFADHIFDTGVCVCGLECPHEETKGIRLSGDLHTHNEQCLVCPAILENVPHTPGTKYDTYDTKQHGVMCAKCDDFYMMEAHDFTNGNGKCTKCDEPCTNCKEGVKNPKTKVGDEAGLCVTRCTTCNKVLGSKAHEFEYYWSKSTCKNCSFECPHAEKTATPKGAEGNYDKTSHNIVCDLCENVVETANHDFKNDASTCVCTMACPGPVWLKWEAAGENGEFCHALCDRCGELRNDPATKHTFDGTGNEECQMCHADCPHLNQERVGGDEKIHKVRCIDCKKLLSESEEHTFVNGECTGCKRACDCKMGFDDEKDTIKTHTKVCSICGKSETGKHTFNLYFKCTALGCGYQCEHQNKEAVEANHDGVHNMKCLDCNNKLPGGFNTEHNYNGDPICDDCGRECKHSMTDGYNVNARGHASICKYCGETLERVGHTFSATTGKCTACDYECRHPANQMQHIKHDDWKINHEDVCGVCEKSTNVAHDFTTGTCVCTEVCPHSDVTWTKTNEKHTKHCNVCNTDVIPETKHDFDTTTGKCNTWYCDTVCDHDQATKTYTPEAGTTWHQIQCDNCKMSLPAAYHVYDQADDKCICGEPCPHTGATYTQVSTNKHKKSCADCGFEQTVKCTYAAKNNGNTKTHDMECVCGRTNGTASHVYTTNKKVCDGCGYTKP